MAQMRTFRITYSEPDGNGGRVEAVRVVVGFNDAQARVELLGDLRINGVADARIERSQDIGPAPDWAVEDYRRDRGRGAVAGAGDGGAGEKTAEVDRLLMGVRAIQRSDDALAWVISAGVAKGVFVAGTWVFLAFAVIGGIAGMIAVSRLPPARNPGEDLYITATAAAALVPPVLSLIIAIVLMVAGSLTRADMLARARKAA